MLPYMSRSILISGLLTAGLSACGGSGSDIETSSAQSGMPGMANLPATSSSADATATHIAEGTLNSINLDEGTVNISHGPVPSADWPEMTMGFKLENPESARAREPGQRIRFEFTIEGGMSATVTNIEKVN